MRITALASALLLSSITIATATPPEPSSFEFEGPLGGAVYRYTCRDIANAIIAARVRIRSSEDLLFQATHDPVGPVTSLFDYAPELQRAHEEKERLIAAATANGCKVPRGMGRELRGY